MHDAQRSIVLTKTNPRTLQSLNPILTKTMQFISIAILVALAMGPCTSATNLRREMRRNGKNNQQATTKGNGRRGGMFGQRMQGDVDTLVVDDPTLTEAQVADLLYMREEEKMARDVYAYFFEDFGTRVFENIMRSEQHHMDMVFGLMEAYGIEGQDPVLPEAGLFTNDAIQALYTELTRDVTTLPDALRNAALIEETDILDLRDAITDLNGSQPAMAQVYERLEKASENHLRAFARLLEDLEGEDYEKQHDDMDQDDVDTILAAGSRRGGKWN